MAHGSRDAGWAAPFQALRDRLVDALGADRVRLAYLQMQSPTLDDALAEAARDGVEELAVLPLLLGAGDHVRREVPQAVARAAVGRARVLPALLENDGVVAAVEALAKAAILPS